VVVLAVQCPRVTKKRQMLKIHDTKHMTILCNHQSVTDLRQQATARETDFRRRTRGPPKRKNPLRQNSVRNCLPRQTKNFKDSMC
jgi:hypothetical protein